MTDQEQDVLNTIKERLGIADDTQDTLITSYLMEIEWRIKHYCQRSDIPKSMNWVWASMVIDALRIENPSVIPAGVGGAVAGVKIGDTSIGGGGGSGVTAASKGVIDRIVLNYMADLHRWRKMKW